MSAAERNGTLGLAGAPLYLCSEIGCTRPARSRFQRICKEHHREYQAKWRKQNNTASIREDVDTLAVGQVSMKARIGKLEAEVTALRAQLAILASR